MSASSPPRVSTPFDPKVFGSPSVSVGLSARGESGLSHSSSDDREASPFLSEKGSRIVLEADDGQPLRRHHPLPPRRPVEDRLTPLDEDAPATVTEVIEHGRRCWLAAQQKQKRVIQSPKSVEPIGQPSGLSPVKRQDEDEDEDEPPAVRPEPLLARRARSGNSRSRGGSSRRRAPPLTPCSSPASAASRSRKCSETDALLLTVENRRHREGFLVALLSQEKEGSSSRGSTAAESKTEKASMQSSLCDSSLQSVTKIAAAYQSSLRRARIHAHVQKKKAKAAAAAAVAGTEVEGTSSPIRPSCEDDMGLKLRGWNREVTGNGDSPTKKLIFEQIEFTPRVAPDRELERNACLARRTQRSESPLTSTGPRLPPPGTPGESCFSSETLSTRPGTHSGVSSWRRGPVERTSHGASSRRQSGGEKPMVVASMAHAGSIYEEVARQLVNRFHWARVQLVQRGENSGLYCPEKGSSLNQMNVHLLLGEKLPTEKVSRDRREAMRAAQCEGSRGGNRGYPGMQMGRRPPPHFRSGGSMPIPMGDDGLPRVVNYIETMRSITLKCSMVKTLLKHHQMEWRTLGTYMPQTFFIASKSCGARADERVALMHMARRAEMTEDETPLWILKSSAGCHGKGIKIFKGDPEGIQRTCDFVDRDRGNTKNSSLWVAQRYVDKPLLFHRRKFDIRCLALFRCDDASIFVHREMVMRLSSVEYSRETALCENPNDVFAHITNHCIQTEAEEYAAYEEDNELWREHLDGLVRFKGKKLLKQQRRMEKERLQTPRVCEAEDAKERQRQESGLPSTAPHLESMQEPTLANTILPQMNYIIKDTIRAGQRGIPVDAKPPPTHAFQLFGYDFIVDELLHVWLLEINGSPGIASRLVRQVAADIIDLAILPVFRHSHLEKRRHAQKSNSGRRERQNHFFPENIRKPKRRNGFERIYPTELPPEEDEIEDSEEGVDMELE